MFIEGDWRVRVDEEPAVRVRTVTLKDGIAKWVGNEELEGRYSVEEGVLKITFPPMGKAGEATCSEDFRMHLISEEAGHLTGVVRSVISDPVGLADEELDLVEPAALWRGKADGSDLPVLAAGDVLLD